MRKIIIAALILAMSFSLAGCSDITWLLDLNHSSGSSRSTYATDNGRSSLGPPPYTCCICGEAPGVCDCGSHYTNPFSQIDGQYYCWECAPLLWMLEEDRYDPQTTVDADTEPDDLYIGETVSFGGSAWTVLDIQGSDVLLLSEYCVNIRRYDDDSNDWDSSEIKAWLNDEYFDTAFSEAERAAIVDRGQGNIFILSIEEAGNYSVENGGLYKIVYENGKEDEKEILWWLRPSGSGDDHAAYLSGAGNVFEDGISVTNEYCGVRPAIWIELE